jgi:hypothetical protein
MNKKIKVKVKEKKINIYIYIYIYEKVKENCCRVFFYRKRKSSFVPILKKNGYEAFVNFLSP